MIILGGLLDLISCLFAFSDSSELSIAAFQELQTELHHLDCDFHKLCKIQAIVLTLHDQYKVSKSIKWCYYCVILLCLQGITVQEIHDNIRVLQRKLETVRDRLRRSEPCRVDVTIPGRWIGRKKIYSVTPSFLIMLQVMVSVLRIIIQSV